MIEGGSAALTPRRPGDKLSTTASAFFRRCVGPDLWTRVTDTALSLRFAGPGLGLRAPGEALLFYR